ncbi:MAG: AbrB/MazE/SpoVT family DNA-binding domain-containing protein [archaeon]
MKRKIVLNGPSTLTVSLPAKWAKSNNIKKGDEVHVTDENNMLKISVQENFESNKKTQVDVSGLSHAMTKSIIDMIHKSGYDEIEVFFDNAETVRILSERIQSTLIGYEIVEQSSKSCVIKSISNIQKGEFENLLRRVFRVTLSLAEGVLETVKNKDFTNINESLILEKTNNRLTNYCERILNKQSYKDEKTVYLFHVLWLLESIGDDYRNMIKFMGGLKNVEVNKEIIKNIELVNGLLKMYYELFYKYNHQDMDVFRQKYKEVLKNLDNSAIRKDTDISINNHLHSITNRIYDCLGSTTGLHA